MENQEQIERVASAIAIADDYNPNDIPHTEWLERTEHYRALARAAIAAMEDE